MGHRGCTLNHVEINIIWVGCKERSGNLQGQEVMLALDAIGNWVVTITVGAILR